MKYSDITGSKKPATVKAFMANAWYYVGDDEDNDPIYIIAGPDGRLTSRPANSQNDHDRVEQEFPSVEFVKGDIHFSRDKISSSKNVDWLESNYPGQLKTLTQQY